MKRSGATKLLMMGVAPLMLTACDNEPRQHMREQTFPTVDACVKAGNPQADCESAERVAKEAAIKSAPQFQSQEECAKSFGTERCQQHTDQEHGSFWMPLMTGFLIAHMMRGGTPSYYGAQPVYRQTNGQDYRPTSGLAGATTTSTGRSSSSAASAATASRGGFGESAAGHGGAGE